MPYVDQGREATILVSPTKNFEDIPFHCTIQLVINYRYKKQHFVTVATIVQTLTTSIEKMYAGINTSVCISTLAKFANHQLRN